MTMRNDLKDFPTIDSRVAAIKSGERPEWSSYSDTWFTWYPVRIGAFGTGPLRWLTRLWRNRCCGVTIYQDLES